MGKRNRLVMTMALGACAATALAAATDGTWIQPLNDNYNMSTGQYWLHAAVANGGGSVKFINQNGQTKKLNNDVGTLTWNNVDLGAGAFTALLLPALDEGSQRDAAPRIQKTYALGPAELVRGAGQKVDMRSLHVDG